VEVLEDIPLVRLRTDFSIFLEAGLDGFVFAIWHVWICSDEEGLRKSELSLCLDDSKLGCRSGRIIFGKLFDGVPLRARGYDDDAKLFWW
jgi:hypothetical protein